MLARSPPTHLGRRVHSTLRRPAPRLLRLTLFCREVSKSLSEMARIVSLYVSRLKQGGVRDLRLRAGFRSGVLQGGEGQRKRDCRTITVGDLRPITLGSSTGGLTECLKVDSWHIA